MFEMSAMSTIILMTMMPWETAIDHDVLDACDVCNDLGAHAGLVDFMVLMPIPLVSFFSTMLQFFPNRDP
jgi:hypothetical protein